MVSRSLFTSVAIALATFTTVSMVSPVLAKPLLLSQVGLEQIKVKEKRRIAVLDFDFANVSITGSNLGLYADNGPAKGISNLLTNRLVKDGTYVVIERSRINDVLAEQNFGQSGRVEPTTAAQIGRILGVDAVLIGSITQFNFTEKRKGFSFGGIGVGKKRQNANVQLAARLVSTATGEILTAAEGNGTASDKSSSNSVDGLPLPRVGGVSVDESSEASDRILGEASILAVDEIVAKLKSIEGKLATLPSVLPTEEMVIADITGDQVVLNKGGNHGFRPGMLLSVERVIKEIKDPVSGKLLRRQTQSLGRLQLTEVDPQSSLGVVLSGQGFEVGDRAKAVN